MTRRFLLLLLGLSLSFALASAQKGYHQAARKLQPTEAYDNVHVQKLFSDPHATGFVIWIKKAVPLHKHAAHSETVTILEGKAQMRLGDQNFPVAKGDIIFIPEGTPHSVQVQGGVLKVLSVQAPEFDGSDRILLDQ